jgi:small subunit ribosomal protein S16
MLTIRLTRVGKKKDASFRVVVIESKRKIQAGNYLEMVGSYDPRANTTTLKADRIKHWLTMGATVSDTVHNLLVSQKIIDAKKINVLPKKVLAKPAEAEAAPEAVVTSTETQEQASADVAETTEEKADTVMATVEPTEDNPVVEEKPTE